MLSYSRALCHKIMKFIAPQNIIQFQKTCTLFRTNSYKCVLFNKLLINRKWKCVHIFNTYFNDINFEFFIYTIKLILFRYTFAVLWLNKLEKLYIGLIWLILWKEFLNKYPQIIKTFAFTQTFFRKNSKFYNNSKN